MLPGIGVFGTGNIIKIAVPFLREKGFKIEAIWGRTLAAAEEVAKELDIPFYTNKIDDVLLRKDVDLIFIISSPNLHSQIAVKALGIGKHVLCDKPAGLCQSEALKMVRAAQYYPSLISIVNHSLRFLPAFSQMRKAIADGYLGTEKDITVCDVRVQMGSLLHDTYDWLCDGTMGGGVLTLVGSHVIDLVSHLICQRAVKVHGVVRTFNKQTEHVNGIRNISSPDFCSFQMEMSGGTLVTVTLNNHLPGQFHQEFLICGKGHLVVRGGDLYGMKQGASKEDVIYLDVEDLQKCGSINPVVANSIPKPYMKGLFKMMGALKEAFLPVEDKRGWVKEPVALAATFEDGLYVQAVIDALRKSSSNKEWVKVTIITEEPDPNPLLSAAVRRSGISV
ncbi:glucose-fructose oxidoreductase domain-containing protein 1-like [Macrosteles quadrilineatus]|uniref:glucose-fructose oxidoreductase domain-containing protein 1-like n=1 Tax=Macrosteles quadrilineatus TaxID=74068 RepID=UPI0023E19CBE|nr:glucose-fructose oxidoreductase domain-containing protein 1-like [Macrosteles quadrilineatus]XP_054288216.1 glucose-fructose oxidoreductase domain-containing protein 1-like [Macrosteles quadrilineatus]